MKPDNRIRKGRVIAQDISRFFPQRKLDLDLKSDHPGNFIRFTTLLKPSRSILNQVKIAKKLFLNRCCGNMSLQFEVEEHPRSLVSLSYASSEEDMEVDSVTSVQDQLDRKSDDEDIQIVGASHPQAKKVDLEHVG